MNPLPLLLRSVGPEVVALEEDPQMDEVALVGAWLEVVAIVPMMALVGVWEVAAATVPMRALEWAAATVPMKSLAAAWVVAADIVPTTAPVGAWAVVVATVPTTALVGAWVEVVDIALMKVLDMGGHMATGLMMSLVTEATTIEGHLLMSTEATMALAMGEGVTEGTTEATVMEETCPTALSADIL